MTARLPRKTGKMGAEREPNIGFTPKLDVTILVRRLLENPYRSAHCAAVRRNPLTRVIRRKPILSEQALPVLQRSPRPRGVQSFVDAEGSLCGLAHN